MTNLKTMKKLLFALILFASCKKEDNPNPVNPGKTYNYETITYIAYGTHNFYDIEYMKDGVQRYISATGTITNKNWSYTFTDTVGSPKRLVYTAYQSPGIDTMTVIIKINNITTDSVTAYSPVMIIGATQ